MFALMAYNTDINSVLMLFMKCYRSVPECRRTSGMTVFAGEENFNYIANKKQMWVLQHKDYGLGNFTNLTPTIKEFSRRQERPVDVYFESPYVEEIYSQSPYINPLKERPNTDPLFSSSLINKEIADWKYVSREVLGHELHFAETHTPERKIVCIMNGCANEDKREAKNPGGNTYRDIVSMIPADFDVYFLGNVDDLNANYWVKDFPSISTIAVNEPKLCQHLLATCDFVVSNDTGWYHVAGAYGKKGFIMWKDTLFEKNKSPNENFFYSHKGNWINDFKEWLTTSILY